MYMYIKEGLIGPWKSYSPTHSFISSSSSPFGFLWLSFGPTNSEPRRMMASLHLDITLLLVQPKIELRFFFFAAFGVLLPPAPHQHILMPLIFPYRSVYTERGYPVVCLAWYCLCHLAVIFRVSGRSYCKGKKENLLQCEVIFCAFVQWGFPNRD